MGCVTILTIDLSYEESLQDQQKYEDKDTHIYKGKIIFQSHVYKIANEFCILNLILMFYQYKHLEYFIVLDQKENHLKPKNVW